MKRQKGLVLLLALLIMTMLVSAMGIAAYACRLLSDNCRRGEYDCGQENLQASGRAWVNLHRTNLTPSIHLPTDDLDIPGSRITISPSAANNIKIISVCGRGQSAGELKRDYP